MCSAGILRSTDAGSNWSLRSVRDVNQSLVNYGGVERFSSAAAFLPSLLFRDNTFKRLDHSRLRKSRKEANRRRLCRIPNQVIAAQRVRSLIKTKTLENQASGANQEGERLRQQCDQVNQENGSCGSSVNSNSNRRKSPQIRFWRRWVPHILGRPGGTSTSRCSESQHLLVCFVLFLHNFTELM